MKKKSIFMKGCAAALVAVMALGLGMMSYAAVAVDVNKKCSLTVKADAVITGYDNYGAELAALSIPVSLYKVADIDASGHYKAGADFTSLGIESVTEATTAQEWEKMGLSAFEIVKGGTPAADKKDTMTNGTVAISDLSTGMYLVVVGTYDANDADHQYGVVTSDEYYYEFQPYLISLPSNNYYAATSVGGTTGNDDWIYDVTTGLKPRRTDRLGHLRIYKDLKTFNRTMNAPETPTLGTDGKPVQGESNDEGATFVFRVHVEKNKTVYFDDVIAIRMKDAGKSDPVEIRDLPAKAHVTVSEIYSGSCYEESDDPRYENETRKFDLTADTFDISADEIIGVTFTNDWDEGDQGGYGIVNKFKWEDNQFKHSVIEGGLGNEK